MFYRSRKIIPIYDSMWLDIVISDDTEKLNSEFEAEPGEWFACVFRNNFQLEGSELWRKSIVIVLNPNHSGGSKITPAIIVHESVHIKNKIFNQIGHKNSTNNDEPEAYLVEFIFNIVSDFYEKIMKKEKKLISKNKKDGKSE